MELPLRFVDTRLIDEAARRRLHERVGHYPQKLAYGAIIFECRLAEANDVVDVSCSLSSKVGNKGAILDLEVADADAGAERWRAAQAFLHQAAHSASGFWSRIDNFWLEFDADAASPSFFCHLKVGPSEDSPTELETALQLTDGLAGGNVERAVKENVAHLFSQLHPDQSVASIGWMFGRASRAIRANVICSSVRSALDLLERLNLLETASQAAPLLDPYRKLVSYLVVDLDVHERISPRVGFELFVFKLLDDSDPKGTQMLDILEGQGLCTPQKGRALRRYPSRVNWGQSPEDWPEPRHMSFLASLLARSLVCVRLLNHVKITLGPDEKPSAKAYLAAAFYRRDAETGRLLRLSNATDRMTT
jgi:hypothetical protein